MHQIKKPNERYFGMKVHVAVDSKSDLVHSASVTPASLHDSQQLDQLVTGKETRLYDDSA